ncbi:hypothetical protein SERLA73DRAFT_114364 [Serpula lacrymans var. lacrymans S7.3]|uniref:Elongator complex protein 6 n=2 Tax=Serpula lacrymans var. lacrymans TaxID=341189 RepID=F8Q9Z6_SERL3|nr:uncharacterized protein SERLADRAFT_442534 [Serpula lacrymans var. lacrymans S7.9]EGN94901.1 hypothetical protein SERLA73DRAFT_114364 [Serpula lacrymans var. lacrymans S7.3]EGO20401.1 hypothetical protein SERLADRAFT_442534 [Serpula lacrymans var. lacrymans S7.9]
MFPPAGLLASGHFVLVSDHLGAPADFLLHRFLSTHLRESRNCKCVILSVSEDISRWKATSSKANLNFPQLIASGIISFIDIAAIFGDLSGDIDSSNAVRLRPIYDLLYPVVHPSDGEQSEVLVILDDIATLEWIGVSPIELIRFSRALRALCLKANATLVVRHHILNLSEPNTVFAHMLQTCTYHAEVRPLSSGRSGAVSGEVAFHPGVATSKSKLLPVPRSNAIQYRLTDYGTIYFEKGTAGGIL